MTSHKFKVDLRLQGTYSLITFTRVMSRIRHFHTFKQLNINNLLYIFCQKFLFKLRSFSTLTDMHLSVRQPRRGGRAFLNLRKHNKIEPHQFDTA